MTLTAVKNKYARIYIYISFLIGGQNCRAGEATNLLSQLKVNISFSFIANIIAPNLPWVSLQMIMEIAKFPLFFFFKQVDC